MHIVVLFVLFGSRKLVFEDTCIPHYFSYPVLSNMAKKGAKKAAAEAPKAMKAMKAKKA